MPASDVYAAEDQWSAVLDRGGQVDFFGSLIQVPAQRRFGDIDSVRRYVDAVLSLSSIATTYPRAGKVTIRERAGQGRAHYETQSATIALPLRSTWAARESVVLHELAHHLACSLEPQTESGRRREWHGLTFRQAMCALAEAVLGDAAALLLRTGYEEAGLRTVATA